MKPRVASAVLSATLVLVPLGTVGTAYATETPPSPPASSADATPAVPATDTQGNAAEQDPTASVQGWSLDPATAKGGETLEASGGWLRFVSGDGNGNSASDAAQYPAIAVYDQEFDFTTTGSFHATVQSPNSADTNRFGFYLGYTDPGNGLFVGFDKNGWYWQKYTDGDGPWYENSSRIPSPKADTPASVTVSWDGRTATVTVDGVKAFDVDYSSMTNLTGRLAMKAGSYRDATHDEKTDVSIRDFPAEDVSTHAVTGIVRDAAGAPVAGATVAASGASCVTGADGAFRLEGLRNGEHTLGVSAAGYESATVTVTVDGDDVALDTDITLAPAAVVETETLKTEQMTVALKKHFPSVLTYTMSDGKVMHGQTKDVRTVEINGVNVELTDKDVTFTKDSDTKATYVLTVKNTAKHVDAVVTVEISVEKNTLHMDVTKIENKADEDTHPIQTISFPNHSLVSVRADQDNAQFTGAIMSSSNAKVGDENIALTASTSMTDKDYMYAFVSGGGLSAGLWSNSEHDGRTGSGTDNGGNQNTRVYATTQDVDGVRSLGLASAPWYYHRVVTDTNGTKYTADETEMPQMAVAIAGDQNEDGTVNWQDGAIAYRSIMNNPYKSEEVPELVAWRIAMNFGGQAQNPFLTTLDNVKKVALNTDGLGQSVLLKGYGNEGHDSGHPDYADIGERIGGADDMNELMEKGAEYGARFGIHVNASEMYPEAKAFSEDLLRRNGNGSLYYSWDWIDQAIGINGIYDLMSGERENRFQELKDEVGDNLDFIYLDVWGTKHSGAEDSWETRRVADTINSLGWNVGTEYGTAMEYEATFHHWAADLTGGNASLKGENSEVMRFLRNHQKDSWMGDYPKYGQPSNAPLLGGYSMTDFEGWQGRNDYDKYIRNLYTYDVSTKFIQHFKVTRWVNNPLLNASNGNANAVRDTSVNNGNEQITLKDDNGNTLVLSRGSNDTSNAAYRQRTITLNGVTIATGAVSRGDNGTGGTESYLLPWMWDASTGDLLGSDDQRLYHWNTTGGQTEWTLPTGWENLSSVKVYRLTDQGKTDEQDVAVVDGKVTLSADAQTPYVVYKGEAKQIQVNWSDGMHVVDAGFNGGQATLEDNWTVTGNGTAEVVKTQAGNPVLRLDGDATVTQTAEGLTPGERYALYLGVDNRSDGDATVSVADGSTVLASNSTGRSIARNYVKAYAHNTNSPTVGGSSYFQNMYVWFTAPESGKVTLTLSHEGEGSAYWDDVRFVRNDYDGITCDEQGRIVTLTNDFEDNAQGIWPFVMAGIEGVEDNRIHMAERHDPYTQAGWEAKKMDDVIDGDWSIKIHGLTGGGKLAYQTIPQTMRFEPGVTYKVSFDYQSGSEGTYAIAVGHGEYSADSVTLTPLAKALGEDGHAEFTVTGSLDGDSWFGISSTTTAADTQGVGGKAANLGGYKDLVLDNLRIERVDAEAKTKEEAQALLKTVRDEYDSRRADFSEEAWNVYRTTLTEARVLIDKDGAGEADYTSAYTLLTALGEYMRTAPGSEGSSRDDIASDRYTVSTGSAETSNSNNHEEGPAALAQDGDANTRWHTEYRVNAVSNGTAWYQFDLGEPATVSGLRYLPRPGGANVNGKIKGYTITLTLADGTTREVDGTFRTDTVWQKVSFEPVENVTAVRLTAKSSAGDTAGNTNKFAAAAELRIVGPGGDAEDTVDRSALQALVDQAGALSEKDYTADSWTGFAAALAKAGTVLSDEDADDYDVALAVENLNHAMRSLVRDETPDPGPDPEPEPVDKSALTALLADANKLAEDDYTAESWAPFAQARTAAQQTLDDSDATAEAVAQAVATLQGAMDALVEETVKPDPDPSPDPDPDPSPDPDPDPLPDPDPDPTPDPDPDPTPTPTPDPDKPGPSQPTDQTKPGTTGKPTGKPSTKPGTTAHTGASIATAATAGFVLLAGAVALVVARRRRMG
ncbi:endo-alpha-N-acetylgalactosaminidase family protein [Bifidobacterium samirii]|uniref:Endo-alpha-N-acetylgalactosaminidase n=1 Tax=Bifidobacterium samirii TaxID=2306974 RepID=A0A430FUL6_9BIFI|nr:endo-alpha-N-acetylgalactosaminidase family protein [Bifidobacterium samirii]RSX56996.1 Endo-alpha-N-acetylgalactosaminidase [Bifidobacterium samirii]